jgi:hypothetical protein
MLPLTVVKTRGMLRFETSWMTFRTTYHHSGAAGHCGGGRHMGEFLTALLNMWMQRVTQQIEEAKQLGRQEAEIQRLESLLNVLKDIASAFVAGASRAATASGSAIEQAALAAQRLCDMMVAFAQDNAADLLEDATLASPLAVEASQRLHEALNELIRQADMQGAWLRKRFSPSLWMKLTSWLYRWPYREIDPSDVELMLGRMITSLRTATGDTKRALVDLNLAHHPLNYFLLAAYDATPALAAPNPSSLGSYAKTSVNTPDIQRFHAIYRSKVSFMREHAKKIKKQLGKAAQLGGKVDARAVREECIAVTYLCLFGILHAQALKESLRDINMGVVEAVKND